MITALEVDEYLVELLQALCIAFRLEWYSVICDGSLQFNTIEDVTIDLEVELGIEHHILVVAHGNTSAIATIVFELVEIYKTTGSVQAVIRAIDKEYIIRIDHSGTLVRILPVKGDGHAPVCNRYEIEVRSMAPVYF